MIKTVKKWLPLLLAVLSLTGCGPSPEERLQQDMEKLCLEAVDRIFAATITRNSDAKIYGVSGKELIVISNSPDRFFNASKNMELVPLCSYYQVSHLKTSASGSYSDIQKHDQAPYSHKARLSLNISYEARNARAVPGMEVHIWTPENYTSPTFDKLQWLENSLLSNTNFSIDPAIVIHNILKTDPVPHNETRSFEIFYNAQSQKWEFTTPPPSMTPPPVYAEYEVNTFMLKHEFKKVEAISQGQTKVFWFNKEGYKIASKGLIKSNGKWKSKLVDEQSSSLKKAMDEWKKQPRISFKDFDHFCHLIRNNPLAENRDTAVQTVEQTFRNVFIAHRNEHTAQYRNWLLFLLDFTNKNQDLLNQELLTREIRQKLEGIEQSLVIGAQKYIKEFTAIKPLVSSITPGTEWEAFKRQLNAESKLNFAYNIESAANVKDKLLVLHLTQVIGNDKLANECLEAWRRIDTLKKIIDDDKYEIQRFLEKGGRLGKHCPPNPCNSCFGKKKKNCSQCKNTGVCAVCKGEGFKYVTEKRKRGWKMHDFKIRTQCSKRCTDCKDRQENCPACSGHGVLLDKDLCLEALVKEVADIQKLFEETITALNSVPIDGKVAPNVLSRKTITQLGPYKNVIVRKVTELGIEITHANGTDIIKEDEIAFNERGLLANEIARYKLLQEKRTRELAEARRRRELIRQKELEEAARKAAMKVKYRCPKCYGTGTFYVSNGSYRSRVTCGLCSGRGWVNVR